MGVLESWSLGVLLKSWGLGVLGSWGLGVLGSWVATDRQGQDQVMVGRLSPEPERRQGTPNLASYLTSLHCRRPSRPSRRASSSSSSSSSTGPPPAATT